MSHSERGYKMKARTPLPVKPARNSRTLCKSSKNGYILLLGQADAGKSTTLNFLFGGREISPVERQTGTQEITEFSSAQLNSGVLKIIDTPGLGDLNGIEWDSQIITTMDTFRKSHEELNTHIPNVVLIFGRFDDNRIEGDAASFVKMLKSVDLRRDKLFDPKHNNVIIVLTHVMHGKRALRENPSPRIELVKSLVKTFTRFPHPPIILLGENEAEDFELPPSSKSQGSYVLPNGEEYPQNIIDKIFEVCHASDDKTGLQIFLEAFTPENRNSLKFCRSISISVVDGAKSNSSEIAMQLTNVYFNKSTEMLDKLSIEWNALGRSCTEPVYQDFLAELVSKNYKDYHLIPKDLNKVMKLLISFKREPDLIFLMEKVMGLIIPTWNEITQGRRNVGMGYSADMDTFKDFSPIEFRNYKTSPHLIYKLPEDVHYHPQRRSGEIDEAIIFHFARQRGDYCMLRTEQLKIRKFLMVPGLPLKPGYNLYPDPPKAPPRRNKLQKSNSKQGRSPPTPHFVTLVKEFRLGKLTYENSRENHTLDYNFVTAIKQLQPFTTKIRTIREQWRTFFHTYGTHVIGGGFVGGAMEIQMHSQAFLSIFTSSGHSIEEPRDVQKVQMEIFAHLFDPQRQQISTFKPINIPQDLIWRVNFYGGQHNYTHEGLMELDASGRANFLAEWKSSLYENPLVLEKDLELIDMKEFVSQMSRVGNVKMEKVVNSYDYAFDTLLVKLPRQSKDKNCNLL